MSARAYDIPADNVVRVWFEPKSMHLPVTLPLQGAERTELALGRQTAEGFEPFSARVMERLGIAPEQLFAAGRVNARADLARLQPHYVRDRRKVIQYAELTSTEPIVASAVLAPKFLSLFRDTLGDSVYVVVPSRYTAYVFPTLVTHYQEYYPLVFEAFRATAYPVSVEVFEFSARGIRTAGVYQEP